MRARNQEVPWNATSISDEGNILDCWYTFEKKCIIWQNEEMQDQNDWNEDIEILLKILQDVIFSQLCYYSHLDLHIHFNRKMPIADS